MSTYTVADFKAALKSYPDHVRVDIFSTVEIESDDDFDSDAIEVHAWHEISYTRNRLTLVAKSASASTPRKLHTVKSIREVIAEMDQGAPVTFGFSREYGKDRPLVSIHDGWTIDDGQVNVCIEIVRVSLDK